MTNINKAAKTIYTFTAPDPEAPTPNDAEAAAYYAAHSLRSAGLLAPDLPPVTRPELLSEEWYAFVEEWGTDPMWETPERHGFSAGHEDGSVNVYVFRDGHNVTDIDILTPEEAEALGLALLAAAQHARGQA